MHEINIRKANTADIPFLVKAIAAAEKSNTNKLSYATLFGITDAEAMLYIKQMLEEDISGCELSVDSFRVIEVNSIVAGAFAGWDLHH